MCFKFPNDPAFPNPEALLPTASNPEALDFVATGTKTAHFYNHQKFL
jgi:hypothetical protein